MQSDRVLEEHLTREELQALRNKRTGMLIFQISWIMIFVSMVLVNWQMRFSPDWKTPKTVTASGALGAFATASLGLSAFLVNRALKAVQAGHMGAFLSRWLGAIVLGILFIVVMVSEWFAITPGTQYGQVFRVMTGFHVMHAFFIGLYLSTVYRNGRRGRYSQYDLWAVEAGAKLWYFVLVAWLLFYVVIYWI